MCSTKPAIESLAFLQSKLATVVDHSDREEAEQFRSLLTCILAPPSPDGEPPLKRFRADEEGDDGEEGESSPTSVATGEAEAATAASPPPRTTVSAEYMLGIPDPSEKAGSSGLPGRAFEQRTAVFESLLEFVDQEAKQPTGNLLDLVDLPGLGGRNGEEWE